MHEGKLDFPIDGYILNHVAEILGQKYELNKYTVGFPITTSAEVAEMRIYLHKLAKDYLKLLESLKGHNKFNYHVMFDDQFFKNVPVSSIDRYIVFNGAFYYKRNKINYLDTLLNSLSPGGQALLVLDNGASRFKVGELSLGEYLASKWPEIFSVEHVTNYGMQNDSMTQQILFITKPTDQHIPVLSKFLAIEENEFTAGSSIPRTKIKELK